jgi:thiol-disulfide isomerase/thioredoxin
MKRRAFAVACLGSAAPSLLMAQPAPVEWPPIQLLDGSTLAPESWRGQAAVVVFWETYCPYCKRHNARIDKLHQATRGTGLRVLSVALDTDEAVVRRYMASNKFSFPVALDGGVLRQRLTTRRVIPMTCVLDAQGRLVQSIPGEMAEDDVMELARLSTRPKPI